MGKDIQGILFESISASWMWASLCRQARNIFFEDEKGVSKNSKKQIEDGETSFLEETWLMD